METGDDATLAEMNEFLEAEMLPSRVRMLFQRFYKELESKWRATKQKWPKLLSETKGTLHSGSAVMRFGATDIPVDFLSGIKPNWVSAALPTGEAPPFIKVQYLHQSSPFPRPISSLPIIT